MIEQHTGEKRINRKKAATKKRIIETALELFKEKGFEKTTMEEIADKADIAKRTLYNHFSVKEAIIHEYYRDIISEVVTPKLEQLFTEIQETEARLQAIIDLSIQWIATTMELYEIYVTYRLQNAIKAIRSQDSRSGFHTILAKVIEAGQAKGEITTDYSTQDISQQLETIIVITMVPWLANPEEFNIYEMLKTNLSMFLNGVRGKK